MNKLVQNSKEGQKLPRIHKRHTLKQLYHRQILFTQTLSLIHKDASYRTIQTFLHRKKFDVSLGSIGNLVKKVKTARKSGTPVGKLIDKRSYAQHKKSIQDVQKSGRLQLNGLDKNTQKVVKDSINTAEKQNHVQVLPMNSHLTNKEVLDKQIDMYEHDLDANTVDKEVTRAGLKAIELEDKYPGEGALSLQTIKQYKLINDAKNTALAKVAIEMMSPKELKEFNDKVTRAQDAIIKNIGLSPNGKRLYSVFKKENLINHD